MNTSRQLKISMYKIVCNTPLRIDEYISRFINKKAPVKYGFKCKILDCLAISLACKSPLLP